MWCSGSSQHFMDRDGLMFFMLKLKWSRWLLSTVPIGLSKKISNPFINQKNTIFKDLRGLWILYIISVLYWHASQTFHRPTDPRGPRDASHDVTYVDTFPNALARRPADSDMQTTRGRPFSQLRPDVHARTPIASQTVWRASSRPPLFACLLLLTQPLYTPN